MKTLAALLAFLSAFQSAASATVLREERHAESWRRLPRNPEMEALVELVLRQAGKPMKVPVVTDPEAEDYCGFVGKRSGEIVIAIGKECVGPLRINGQLQWRAVSTLCHEVGHIVRGHLYIPGNHRWEETEADEFAGEAMFRLGATLDQALSRAAQYDEKGSITHPPRDVRVESYKRGWLRAKTAGLPPQRQITQSNWWADLMARKLPWVP